MIGRISDCNSSTVLLSLFQFKTSSHDSLCCTKQTHIFKRQFRVLGISPIHPNLPKFKQVFFYLHYYPRDSHNPVNYVCNIDKTTDNFIISSSYHHHRKKKDEYPPKSSSEETSSSRNAPKDLKSDFTGTKDGLLFEPFF